MKAQGSCLCGKVKVDVKSMDDNYGACHCSMCRKWGGGPLMSVGCGQDVSFKGEEFIQRYNSSDWAQRGFCKNCGTHLFYFLKPKALYIMPIGLLEGTENLKFDHQIFIDSKPESYQFSNKTHNKTGAEVFGSAT